MATPVVDTKPLKLNPNCWVNFRKLNNDIQHALVIDKENKELLKKINLINRNGVTNTNFFLYEYLLM